MFGLTALELARIQFGFTISFHIVYPAITIGLASYLAVLEGMDVVIVDKRESAQAVQTMSQLGSRTPIHCSSLGKALLMGDFETLFPKLKRLQKFTDKTITSLPALRAEIERARKVGVTEAFDEYAIGVSGIAAPIHGVDGALLGVIGISLPTSRADPAHVEAIREAVRDHAGQLCKALGGIS